MTYRNLTINRDKSNEILCPLCNSQNNILWAKARDVEYLTSEAVFSYYHCSECDILFIHPIPLNQLNIIYPKNYYSFVQQKKSFTDKIKEHLDKHMFQDILKRFDKQELCVLDVGGGTGWLLNIIKQIDPRVTLTQIVDLDSIAAKQASAYGHRYFQGRIEEFHPNQKFDLILMLNLIEHVEKPTEVLRSVKNLLSDRGLVLIKTPNFRSLDARIFRHHNWGGYHCPRHWVLFTDNSFSKVIRDVGLKILKLSFTQGAPFWTVGLLAALSDKKWYTITQERPLYQHPLYGIFNSVFATLDFLRRPFSKTSQMVVLMENN